MEEHIECMMSLLDAAPKNSSDMRMLSKMATWMKELEEFNNLDHDFKQTLEDIALHDNATTHNKEEYPEISQTLPIDTTVIYFKSAGIFRAYNSVEFEEKFQNRLRTNYRNQAELYEVIDDNKPQKIVIVVDSRDDIELTKIKNYILSYVKSEKKKIEMDDLVVFDNIHKNTFEIVIKSMSVNNAIESKQFIEGLLSYIEKAENSVETSTKMLTRPMPDIEGANLIMIPETKNLMSSLGEMANGYVTKGIPVVFNVTQIIQGDNIHGDKVTNNYESDTKDNVKDFIKHLNTTKPKWFKKGNILAYNILLEEYITHFEDIKPSQFTKQFGGIVFKKGKRASVNNVRIQMVKIL